MEEMDKILESHQDNDGIQEYDNPLPGWFLYMFYACIVFSFLYFSYYTGRTWALSKAGGVPFSLANSGGDYLASVEMAEKEGAAAHSPDLSGEALLSYLKAPASISGGEAVFKANCVPCHGDQGQGIVGPNLTDEFWLHGGTPDAVLASVTHGYPEKGMPNWKNVLGMEKVRLAAAYVISLRGHQVANPKAPQGVKDP